MTEPITFDSVWNTYKPPGLLPPQFKLYVQTLCGAKENPNDLMTCIQNNVDEYNIFTKENLETKGEIDYGSMAVLCLIISSVTFIIMVVSFIYKEPVLWTDYDVSMALLSIIFMLTFALTVIGWKDFGTVNQHYETKLTDDISQVQLN